VAQGKSGNGSAVMVSDPHLGLGLPNMWLIAGYECPSYHVLGLMFPSLPVVLIGRNERISFSGTNMRAASSDLYELGEEESGRLESSTRRIQVKGWFDKKVTLRRSEWGPVISDAALLGVKDRVYALRWVGHEASDEIHSALLMNRAGDWEEFQDAFAGYAVSGQNYLYADVEGNIGLVPAVRIPKRGYQRPQSLSFPASDPQAAWQGFLSSTELPDIFAPEEGFVASANNLPVQAEVPLGFFFSANDRIQRMQELLAEVDRIDLELISALHTDTYVRSAQLAARAFASAIRNLKGQAAPYQELALALDNWDGHYRAEQQEPVLFQILTYHFARSYYRELYGKKLGNSLLGSDQLFNHLLTDVQEADPGSLSPHLLKALERVTKDSRKYRNWGEMHRLEVKHNLGNLPLIGNRFRYGDYPAGGTTNSLMKTAHELSNRKTTSFYGANARFAAFLNDDTQNYFVLMGGQDGWVGSEGLTDQVPLWLKGEYLRIPFRWEDIQREFEYRSSLQPAAGNR